MQLNFGGGKKKCSLACTTVFTHALEHMQVVNIVLLQPKLRSQQVLQVASQSIVCGSFFETYSFQTHKKHLTTACPS